MHQDDTKKRVDPPPNEGKGEREPAPKPETLTAEEQMARYEEALKNDDWGHQPC